MKKKITGYLVLIFMLIFSVNASFALGGIGIPLPPGPRPTLGTLDYLYVVDQIYLKTGDIFQMKVTAVYTDSAEEDATSKAKYTIRNPEVASVSDTGLVTAKAPGQTVIDINYGNKWTFMNVNVLKPVTSIRLDGFKDTMEIGEEQSITVTAEFKDGSSMSTSSDFACDVGNSGIISIKGNNIRALKPGKCDFSIIYLGFKQTFQVQVLESKPALIDIRLTGLPSGEMIAGTKYYLSVYADYSDKSTKEVTNFAYFSTDNQYVEFYNNEVVAQQPGSAIITVEFEGMVKHFPVTIKSNFIPNPVTKLSVFPDNIDLSPGQDQQLTVYATNEDLKVYDKTSGASYSMSDTSIATVSPTGKVTAKSPGSTTLTVNFKEGTAKCIVTVRGSTKNPQEPQTTTSPFSPTYREGELCYEREAKVLHDLGLYNGISTTKFVPDLRSAIDRVTGVVMFLRVFGLEQEALAMSDSDANQILTQFKDASSIPKWAKKPIAFAIKSKLVLGYNNKFDATAPFSGKAYCTLLLRQLGYTPDYDYAPAMLAEIGGLTVNQAVKFTNKDLIRDDIVGITYNALKAKYVDGKRIIDHLIQQGVVDKEIAEADRLLD